jgi:hypothetical protein
LWLGKGWSTVKMTFSDAGSAVVSEVRAEARTRRCCRRRRCSRHRAAVVVYCGSKARPSSPRSPPDAMRVLMSRNGCATTLASGLMIRIVPPARRQEAAGPSPALVAKVSAWQAVDIQAKARGASSPERCPRRGGRGLGRAARGACGPSALAIASRVGAARVGRSCSVGVGLAGWRRAASARVRQARVEARIPPTNKVSVILG